MSFKYSAFIENTQEVREWVKNLGYKNYGNPFQTTDDSLLFTTIDGKYVPYNVTIRDNSWIDCRGNLELFKAITAVRDDENIKQWFICDTDVNLGYSDIDGNFLHSKIYKGDIFFWDIHIEHAGVLDGDFHKATKEELIMHFGKKQCPQCDDACFYHCTENGHVYPPKCVTKND